MFNFFKKKEKEPVEETEDDIVACITYYVKTDGIPMVDLHMSDYEDQTIKGMEELLIGLSDADFFQDTIEMLKAGLVKNDQHDVFIAMATKIAMEKVQRKLDEHKFLEEALAKGEELLRGKEDNPTNEEPYIKPSDIL